MSTKVRYGLITGAVAALLNLCIGAIPCCGQIAALVAGGVAGYLSAKKDSAPTKGEGAKIGATSGAIAGALALVGQMIGGAVFQIVWPIVANNMGQSSSALSFGGSMVAALGILCCLGLFGIVLGAGAGALAGYLVTPSPVTIAPGQ